MKKIVGRDVLLYYPNLSEIFMICTDDIKTQLGGLMSQSGNSIAFYPHKLTSAQIDYTTSEQ